MLEIFDYVPANKAGIANKAAKNLKDLKGNNQSMMPTRAAKSSALEMMNADFS
jgi:hypothetical protein